jgi:predicted dithiol-disulfide oxidoreductase (DUF899 family)
MGKSLAEVEDYLRAREEMLEKEKKRKSSTSRKV